MKFIEKRRRYLPVKDFLDQSYEPTYQNIQDFEIDPELSGQRAKVYHKKSTKQTVIVHRGSKGLKDWVVTNPGLLIGRKGKRFQHAKKIQEAAKEKYKGTDFYTLGHSLGGAITRAVGKGTKMVTYNAPTLPHELIFEPKHENLHEFRTHNDVVSILRPYQRKGKKKNSSFTIFKSAPSGIVEAHGTEALHMKRHN